MPRPDRSSQPSNQAQPPQEQQSAPKSVSLPVASQGGIREDIRSLSSSILLITQKIKYLVRNEKILGRNLVVLNKKIRGLEEKIVNPAQAAEEGHVSSAEVQSLKQQITLFEAQLEDMRSKSVTKEELRELKYIIDTINPLEFATLSQVRELIDKRLKEKQGSGKI
ncbi:MAG: hypothetical protein NTY48_04675 [Candidatus Diapherotrites archaeon]|nr:hypothetical protein [Candidatus Diapherotrites archaeon]